jgi:hypothetical protein
VGSRRGHEGAQIGPRRCGIEVLAQEHFWFDYPYDPLPGKRYWTLVDGRTWVEQYESGEYSLFKVAVGRHCDMPDGCNYFGVIEFTFPAQQGAWYVRLQLRGLGAGRNDDFSVCRGLPALPVLGYWATTWNKAGR